MRILKLSTVFKQSLGDVQPTFVNACTLNGYYF